MFSFFYSREEHQKDKPKDHPHDKHCASYHMYRLDRYEYIVVFIYNIVFFMI